MTAYILFFLHSIMFKVNIIRSRRYVNVDGFIVNRAQMDSLLIYKNNQSPVFYLCTQESELVQVWRLLKIADTAFGDSFSKGSLLGSSLVLLLVPFVK